MEKFACKVCLEKMALKKFVAEKKRKMFALKSFSENKQKVKTENQVGPKMKLAKFACSSW